MAQKRYILVLTQQERDDIIWAADQGAEQVFGYTNPKADWDMTDQEFHNWSERVNRALAALSEGLKEGTPWP